MTSDKRSGWRRWVPRRPARQSEQDHGGDEYKRIEISDTGSAEMRARALECNLFVVLPDRDILLVGADDQDPGPKAPPFTDFLRVVGEDGPAEYEYRWMIDLLPDDPRVFLELAVARPVEETFLFGFSVPQFAPILERIERDRVLYLSTRSSIEFALMKHAPDMTIAIPFDGATEISELLSRYVKWHAAGRPR
jgi:hypothetical protein